MLRVPHILTTAKPWTKKLLDRSVACDFLLGRIAKRSLAAFYNGFSAINLSIFTKMMALMDSLPSAKLRGEAPISDADLFGA